LCGAPLVYLALPERLACAYCGQSFESSARCAAGHYVCDGCHSLGANDVIEQFCLQSTQTDPVEMALTLMKHPSFNMHGPEHHYLVPAVLLTAWANRSGAGEKARWLRQARQRAEQVKGGFCGYFGDCGAAVGAGIFTSVMTGATPLSTAAWSLANRATAVCLLSIAEHGGPRCCKRNTLLALTEAGRLVREYFDAGFTVSAPPPCEFSEMNKECRGEACLFYPA
jgi:hypothetical protein